MKRIICLILTFILVLGTFVGVQFLDIERAMPITAEEVAGVPTEVENRYLIYRIWSWSNGSFEEFKAIVDDAVDAGFNAIKVHMQWMKLQPTKESPDFAEFEQRIDYIIKEKGLKVAISIDLARQPEGDQLVGFEHLQKDPNGNVGVNAAFIGTAFSFCSDYAVDLAVDFYKTAVAHFHERYGDNILFYLPAFNSYCETEYWAGGQYDYSDFAKEAFRNFLKDTYGSVDTLNYVTEMDFTSFDTIEPPDNFDTSTYGMLWYRFRHDKLKAVIDALADVQDQVAPDTDFAVQFGSVWDTNAPSRGTRAFEELCEKADVVWVDDGPNLAHDWSMDLIRSVFPAHVKIANEIDGPGQSGASPEAYLRQGLMSFQHGATYVNAANWDAGNPEGNFAKYKRTWREIADTWLTGETPEMVTCTKDTPVVEASRFDVYPDTNISNYSIASERGRQFAYVRYEGDILAIKTPFVKFLENMGLGCLTRNITVYDFSFIAFVAIAIPALFGLRGKKKR